MVPFAYIFRQNCLISHTHIIKNFKNFRIKMILMEVTAKDNYFFFLVKKRQFTFVVIKNIAAVSGLNQKTAVVNVSYFHDITCKNGIFQA